MSVLNVVRKRDWTCNCHLGKMNHKICTRSGKNFDAVSKKIAEENKFFQKNGAEP